ncbi:MAG TPA: TonB-dependent receptor [Terriglobales bacterium]|nr:TonB-dependent receptor [Terriglobales bacterium]
MRSVFSRLSFLTILFVFVLTSTIFSYGQGTVTGSISGTLQDAQHAVVTGAKVTALDQATNQQFTTQSNSTGYFTLRLLPIGSYTVTIEAASFSKLGLNNVVVRTGVDTSLGTQTLTAGSTKEVVTVEEATPLVESQTSQITNTFEARKTQDLPIGNGFDQLALLVPGVASTEGAGFGNSNGARLSINGQRSRANNFEIDGQQNNDNSVAGPSIFIGNADVIEEYQVITNYEAQYGRNMGGVVNYVTKSGSNAFHGTALEYFTGNFTDSLANEEKSPFLGFCTSGQTPAANGCNAVKLPRYVDNQFGGTLGGPIKRDKLWFFGSGYFQRTRTGSSPSTSTLLTPTPNGLAQLKTAFPGNNSVNLLSAVGPLAVPVGSPTFTGIKNQFVTATPGLNCNVLVPPAGCVPIEFGNITRSLPSLYNDYETTGRVDWQASDKDRVFTRYLFQQTINTNATGDFAAGYVVDVPARSQQIAIDWTHTFTSNLVNQGRFSYSRANVGFENGTIPGCNRLNPTACPTRINLRGSFMTFGLATNLPQGRLVNVTQWQDNVIWTRGRHTFKFGGEYDRQRSPNAFLPTINGSFTYANAATVSSFSNFLQDRSTFSLTDGPFNFPFKEQDVAWYVQDDWRIKDNLTINLGLRWEWYQQAINLLHDITTAKQASSTPFWDPTLPASLTTVPRVPEYYNNWGPNVGFAWTPRVWQSMFGQDKTVIRGGFRIAYDPAFYNMFSNVASAAPVVNAGSNITQPGALGTTCVGCLPTTGGNGSNVRTADLGLIKSGLGVNPGARSYTTVDPNLRNPYAEEWTFGIQRQIGAHVAAEVRYNGTHTVKQFQSADANPALNLLIANNFQGYIPAGLTPCTDPNQVGYSSSHTSTGASTAGGVPTGGFAHCSNANVVQRGNYAWSKYNALQSALRIQDWHGLSSEFAYTYSHTIDNSFEVFSRTGVGGLSFGPNVFNGNQPEKASSTISFPNVFAMNWVYDLPWYKSQKGLVGHLLGGWEYSGNYRFSSGQLWTPSQNRGETGFASLGDPSADFSTVTDNLRPILSNSAAPLNTLGVFAHQGVGGPLVLINPVAPNCGFAPAAVHVGANPATDPLACGTIAANTVRWIYNDLNAATFFGNPFLGVGRNPGLRGQTVNNVNMGFYKNTQLSERVIVQLRMDVFNVFNRQYRGVPDGLIDDIVFTSPSTFGNNFGNTSGSGEVNAFQNGVARRRIQFGLHLIF